MPRPLRVFLCHASQDKPAVRKLHRYLKQHGIEPWLDEIDLLPGENWEVEIPRAIDDSDVILVCLSKNSINKEGYVQKEISFALDKALEKPDGTIFIIPAKLEDCEVPKRLNRYQWVDLFRPDSNKRLLLGLNKRALSLGSEVSPVIMDDTRQRKPAIKPVVSDPVDRDALEIAQRETAERLVREKVALEKAEQEKQERETAERLVREQKERETAEKAALEKENREKAERETAERIAGEKAEREKVELAQAKQAEKERLEKEKLKPVLQTTSVLERKKEKAPTPAPKLNVRTLGIGGFIFACLFLAVFGGNYLFKNINSAPTEDTPVVLTATATKTKTPNPTQTFTPVPPTLTPTPEIGSTLISDGETMMYIPQGSFSMGSESSSDEKPIHAVLLDAYYIDKYEVTNAAYERCVEANVCVPPSESKSYSRAAYYGNSEFDEYPVIYVDWNMAKTYCEWRGGRLPTEAEWEKAARGEDGRTYPWGEGVDCDKANYNFSCIGDTTKVGSYLEGVSPYGVYDMAGNVWEWVNDWYDGNYYGTSPSSNPQGPTSGQYRVLRGGTWNYYDNLVRSAFRGRNDPAYTYNNLGFRCSLSHP